MNRLSLVLTAFCLSACASAPAPAAAQQAGMPHEQPRTIFVNATAQVSRAPDRAVISLAVETPAESAGAATAGNAESMTRVIEAIRALGVDRSMIRTQRVSLRPEYERWTGREPEGVQREPRIVGYVASNQVVVTVDDVALVGRVVDAGVGAGANRVNGIGFQLRDPESAYHEALRLAIDKARREARVVADAMGVTLGPPLNVTTSSYYAPPPPVPMMADMRMAEMERAVPTPVEPGELDVQATVSISFLIGS